MEEEKNKIMGRQISNPEVSQNHHICLAFLDYQDSDAKIKIHHFSIEQSSSSKELFPETLMEKRDHINKDVNIENIFSIFGQS